MQFLKKLFGIKNKKEPIIVQDEKENDNDEKISFFDEMGKEYYVTKRVWIKDILIPNLEKNYDNPDELYTLIITALNDGLHEFVVDASYKLYEIDKERERAGCIYAIVLMKNKRLDEAKLVLEKTIQEIGKTGVLLTNLAKVYADWNDFEMVEKILFEGLELDPNQNNGMDWYLSLHKGKDGEEGYHKALIKLSKIKDAWRPLLYLADISLKNKDINTAMSYYKKILSINPNPPSDCLIHISSSLGLNNYIEELITFIEPIFNENIREFGLGNNLIKAYIDSKEYEKANIIIEKYFALNNPTIRKSLSYWKNELESLTKKKTIYNSESPISHFSLDKPIWSYNIPIENEIIHMKKENDLKLFVFSANVSINNEEGHHDENIMIKIGRLSRGIALTICDKINLSTDIKAITIIPMLNNGFALFSEKYSKETINGFLKIHPSDIAIFPHLSIKNDLWIIELFIYNYNSDEDSKVISKEFNENNQSAKLKELNTELFNFIKNEYSVNIIEPLFNTEIVSNIFSDYIYASESNLALLMASNIENTDNFLYGERNILDNILYFTLLEERTLIQVLMFLSALANNKKYNSNIYKEYEKKANKLIKDSNFKEEIQLILNNIIHSIYN
ncbi:MAG: hypothetical protein PHY66_10300 [Aliarcobacter sp.]|nr:hypothetical protein [Aliarcobacter sp.]